MQQEILEILKSVYLSGNLGWYSSKQIRKMCLDVDIKVNPQSVNHSLLKLYKSGFIDRLPFEVGFLYRYRHPKKNKFLV